MLLAQLSQMTAVPVERWVGAVGNVLKFLTLVVVLLFAIAAALLLKSWGFTPSQRMCLFIIDLGLMLAAIIGCIVLGTRSESSLYSPYEWSLMRGAIYGTQPTPLTRKQIENLPRQTETPGLLEPSGPSDLTKLPPRGPEE